MHKKMLLLTFLLVSSAITTTEQGGFFRNCKSWTTAFFALFSSKARYFMLGRAAAKGEGVVRSQMLVLKKSRPVLYIAKSNPVIFILSLLRGSNSVQLPNIKHLDKSIMESTPINDFSCKKGETFQEPIRADFVNPKSSLNKGDQKPIEQKKVEGFEPFDSNARHKSKKNGDDSVVNNTMNAMSNQFRMFGWRPQVIHGVDPIEHARVKSQAEGGKYQRAQGRLEGWIGASCFAGFIAWLLHDKKNKEKEPERLPIQLSPYAFNQYESRNSELH